VTAAGRCDSTSPGPTPTPGSPVRPTPGRSPARTAASPNLSRAPPTSGPERTDEPVSARSAGGTARRPTAERPCSLDRPGTYTTGNGERVVGNDRDRVPRRRPRRAGSLEPDLVGVDVERDDGSDHRHVEHPAGLGSGVAGLAVGGLEPRHYEVGGKGGTVVRLGQPLDAGFEGDRRRPRVRGGRLPIREETEVAGVHRLHRLPEHLVVAGRAHAHRAHRPPVADLRPEGRPEGEPVVGVHHRGRLPHARDGRPRRTIPVPRESPGRLRQHDGLRPF